MKTRLAALLTVAALLGGACASDDEAAGTGSGQEPAGDSAEELTIGVSNLGLSFPFPASISEGIHQKADELGVEIVELDAEGDTDKQANDVQDLISQAVDGILLLPLDAGVATRLVDDINEADIPVVAVASQVGEDRPLEDVYPGLAALVTQSEVEAGRLAGEMALEALPDGGDVAIVEGQAGFAEVRLRAQDFKKVLAEAPAGYEIVSSQPGDWLPDKSEAACANMLASNPDIGLFYAESDDMAVGCVEAVEAAGSSAQVIGIGGSQLAIKQIEAGRLYGTVCYKPMDMGELAVETLVKHLTGEAPLDAEFVSYDTPPITKDNVDQCQPQW